MLFLHTPNCFKRFREEYKLHDPDFDDIKVCGYSPPLWLSLLQPNSAARED